MKLGDLDWKCVQKIKLGDRVNVADARIANHQCSISNRYTDLFFVFPNQNKARIGEHDQQLGEKYTVSHLKVIYGSYTGHFHSDLVLIT